jgi:hypothetical protein
MKTITKIQAKNFLKEGIINEELFGVFCPYWVIGDKGLRG